ncbi:MAG: glycosyltransferase family 2 protein [Anaerolineales bacterium]
MKTTPPDLSIVIITWNSSAHILRCLDCLRAQTVQNFEIVIVDNGSTDNTLDTVRAHCAHLDVIIEKAERNLGFAAGNNLGARLAGGNWLALLNADAFPEPDWLEKLLEAAEQHTTFSCFTSRQIQEKLPNLLDGAGDSYHISGLAWRRFYNKPVQEYGKRQQEVFSACPAAALYRREDFLEVGGFDEDYFSYFEDVDLGFRLRLAGKRCLYVPEAVVHHVGSASTSKRSDFSVYYGYRNMIWTFFKDMPSPLIWFFLPLHAATLLFFVGYLSLRGQGRVVLRAIRDAVQGLPRILEKRKAIQKNAKIKSSELLEIMSTGLLEPYLEFVQRNRNVK